jgi:hypothetical protein
MAASPYDGLYWDTHTPLGVHNLLQNLAGQNPSDPNLPDAWSPSEREWFSLPRSANNYSLKHNVYTFGSIGNFFSADGKRTTLGDDGFTADQGNDIDYTQAGAAAQVGRSLNPATFNWIPVSYNTTAYPIAAALQSAVDKAVAMILGSVGGVFLVGNGFGAAVASTVYDEFRTGRLVSRRSDLLGVYNFGNPLRQAGRTIPGGVDPGGHGMAEATKRLEATENLVWEFANPLDPVTVVGDTVATGYQGTDSATLFTVRGTFGRTIEIALGNELGNYETMVGLGVDKNFWNWVDVDYPGDKLSLDAWFNMNKTEEEGKQILINLINKTPGKFALCGMSQGAAVISSVYKEIQSGVLQNRKGDLLAGIAFGNPRRQTGHTIPGGIDPGVFRGASPTHGLLGTGLLTDVDKYIWWDFANPNDFATDIGDDTSFGLCSQAVFQFMYNNPTARKLYVNAVKDGFDRGEFGAVSANATLVTGVAQTLTNLSYSAVTAVADFSNPSDGHMRYHLPYKNLPNNNKSAVQLAIERLNSLPYNTNVKQVPGGGLISARATAQIRGGRINADASLDAGANTSATQGEKITADAYLDITALRPAGRS